MKPIYLCLLFLILSVNLFAQGLGRSKSDIINAYGNNYELGNKTPTIMYKKIIERSDNSSYESVKIYWFDKNDICKIVMIFEPIREINAWIKTFNKEYVKVEEFTWKDYSTEIEYTLETKYVGDINTVVVTMKYY